LFCFYFKLNFEITFNFSFLQTDLSEKVMILRGKLIQQFEIQCGKMKKVCVYLIIVLYTVPILKRFCRKKCNQFGCIFWNFVIFSHFFSPNVKEFRDTSSKYGFPEFFVYKLVSHKKQIIPQLWYTFLIHKIKTA
jgi:hypothetical protein